MPAIRVLDNFADLAGVGTIAQGCTGAMDAATARANLGLGSAATHPVADFLGSAGDGSALTATAGRTGELARTLAAHLAESVNVRDFGVVGDGVTDDRVAFQAAITAAVAAGRPLSIPPGTYLLTFTSGIPKLSITGNLRIQGAGRNQTILQAGPSPSTFLLYCVEAPESVHLEISDLTIRGPADPGAVAPNVPTYNTAAIHLTAATAGTGSCRLAGVRIDGQFCGPIQGDGGVAGIDHTLELRDCDISGYQVLLGYFCEANTSTRRVHVHDSVFHGAANLGGLTGEDLYIHPNVALRVVGCRFVDNPYYSVQHYGSSPNAAAPYAEYRGNVWESGVANALYLGNKSASLVVGNTFHSTNGVYVRHNATITGNTFAQANASSIGITVGPIASGRMVVIAGNVFDSPAGISAGIACGGAGTFWDVGPNVFACNDWTAIDVPAGVRARVVGQMIQNTGGGSGAVAISFAGSGSIRDCHFAGPWGTASGAVSSVPADLQLDNNTFDGPGDRPAWRITATASGIVRARANRYLNGSYPQARTNSTAYQHGQLAPGIGAVHASAATLSLADLNADTFHVTGTVTITQIDTAVDEANDLTLPTLRAFHGAMIRLIADGAWALGTSGNLKPGTTAARVVGEVVSLVYDASTAFWYEV